MIIVLLILSVLIGVFLGKFFGDREKFAKNLLIVSAGFLITICLNEVFPEVYAGEDQNIGLWVIGGVLLQMLLENLTKGFEHGHFHHHTEGKHILPLALMIGLFIHAFLEGIPLANEEVVLTPYLTGILVHNIPISFILGAFLVKNKKFSPSAFLIISIFALASPLGLILGKYFNPNLEVYFLALVGGIFLHISSVIIFESNKNHNVDWRKIGYVMLGVLLAMSTHLFHQH
ncbi:ZIP family metal transporter [Kaistella antarctica]|uniref:ZIP Zinc transporter n=1 Tax=Kaistella antarctica TaxID=266748 RepID=A0A448NNN8_9FLAO|nr:ZIP family metal transporter [Kaistella antarctica]KEY19697.1 zinc permease [Kaistella antarctica]SEV98825.1 ZIP Zinc transporter [Kaistella antarctica]VEH96719.1 ZIP Zinc transporter [Kaistella antarctica]